jgi:hypothetical protein
VLGEWFLQPHPPYSGEIEHGCVYTSAILETLSSTRSMNMKSYIQPDCRNIAAVDSQRRG